MPRRPPAIPKKKSPILPGGRLTTGLARSLIRFAMTLAADRRRSAARRLTTAEIASLLANEDVARDFGDHAQPEHLTQILAELPERRRAILLAVLNGTPQQEIAERFGLSVRTVDNEVHRALEHGLRRLEERRDASADT